MDFKEKLERLDHIYDLYEEVIGGFDKACGEGCSECCTRNVTLTTLEGLRIMERVEHVDNLILKAREEAGKPRMMPKVTTNLLAELCLKGEAVPEEESEVAWGSCPLLSDSRCPLYDHRPFACRCMVSRNRCGDSGYADMDEFIITLNNVFIQYIEHVDDSGYTANLTDMLLLFSDKEKMDAYKNSGLTVPGGNLPKNSQIKMLMVPPEHRKRMEPILHRLFN